MTMPDRQLHICAVFLSVFSASSVVFSNKRRGVPVMAPRW